MQVLLLKDVRRLGHVGDIVDVKTAYARNFLLPQRMAAAPTPENVRAIESEKTRAAEERARKLREYVDAMERMTDVSVTIEAAANPEGTLYGSVGQREIAAALNAQGHAVLPEHVELDTPIRTLDNVMVTIRFTDELSTQVKVWVVREGGHVESPEPDTDVEEPVDES